MRTEPEKPRKPTEKPGLSEDIPQQAREDFRRMMERIRPFLPATEIGPAKQPNTWREEVGAASHSSYRSQASPPSR